MAEEEEHPITINMHIKYNKSTEKQCHRCHPCCSTNQESPKRTTIRKTQYRLELNEDEVQSITLDLNDPMSLVSDDNIKIYPIGTPDEEAKYVPLPEAASPVRQQSEQSCDVFEIFQENFSPQNPAEQEQETIVALQRTQDLRRYHLKMESKLRRGWRYYLEENVKLQEKTINLLCENIFLREKLNEEHKQAYSGMRHALAACCAHADYKFLCRKTLRSIMNCVVVLDGEIAQGGRELEKLCDQKRASKTKLNSLRLELLKLRKERMSNVKSSISSLIGGGLDDGQMDHHSSPSNEIEVITLTDSSVEHDSCPSSPEDNRYSNIFM